MSGQDMGCCTIARASAILNVSDRHIMSLLTSGQLHSYGRGVLQRVTLESIQIYKQANPQDIASMPRGYIYIIYWHGYYKIGQAGNANRRIKEIGRMHPIAPTVIHLIPTDSMDRLEKRLHKVFAGKRISGEWFDLDDEDIQRIKAIDSYLMNYKTRKFPDLPI